MASRQVHVDRACAQKLHRALSPQKHTELNRLLGHGFRNSVKSLEDGYQFRSGKSPVANARELSESADAGERVYFDTKGT